MSALIPHSRPTISEDDVQAVTEVIRSGFLAQGERVREFERHFAAFLGMREAVATSSGTAALHLALLALGVGMGDEVICPSYVCVAVLHAIRYTGATPVLADIEPQTYNLSPQSVRQSLTSRTKALIVPHLFGLPADVDELLSFGLPLIEDCAQMVGGQYHGRPVGTLGTVAIFSFYATKLLCTGEGGMVVCDAPEILARLQDLREYDERPGGHLRFNYKMTDLQAALGLSQLARLPAFIQRRKAIAACYTAVLRELDIDPPTLPPDRDHIFFRYVVRRPEPVGPVLERFAPHGIVCRRPVFRPIHQYLEQGGFPESEAAWEHVLSVPIYPSLTEQEVDCVVAGLRAVLRKEE